MWLVLPLPGVWPWGAKQVGGGKKGGPMRADSAEVLRERERQRDYRAVLISTCSGSSTAALHPPPCLREHLTSFNHAWLLHNPPPHA